MTKQTGPRQPSKSDALTTPSLPEIKGRVDNEVTRLNEELGLRFRDRRFKHGALINLYLLYVLDLPEPDRDRIAQEYMRVYEDLLGWQPRGSAPKDAKVGAMDRSSTVSDRPSSSSGRDSKRKAAKG